MDTPAKVAEPDPNLSNMPTQVRCARLKGRFEHLPELRTRNPCISPLNQIFEDSIAGSAQRYIIATETNAAAVVVKRNFRVFSPSQASCAVEPEACARQAPSLRPANV